MSDRLRRQLIETAIALNASGINQGTSGNLSVRIEGGMLITPSGLSYHALESSDIVFMTLDGDSGGPRAPSSEWRFHLDIYRHRPDAGAVVHAHPAHCSALACLHKAIPAFHYMVAVAGGTDIRCAPYATFGTQQLSDHVLEALRDRKAALMANHGVVCIERDPPRALALAIEVEHLARTYSQALTLGKPVILSDKEMAAVLDKFRSYGLQGIP